MSGNVALVALAIALFALISKRVGPTVISSPMIFVALGLLTGPEVADWVDLELELEAVDIIGEATLGILLFADASRIDTRSLRRNAMLPTRLLGIGLPLTVAFNTVTLMVLVDGLEWAEAALIGAILSPTDAALGQEVVSDRSVPVRIRQGLTVESGLNDGLVVPAVALFAALSSGESEESASFWARFAFEQIGIGLVVGLLAGGLGAMAINRAFTADWIDPLYAQIATLALAVIALTGAIAFDGNGFIATFVAGLVFGRVAQRSERLGEYTEDTAQLAAAVSFFLFGNLLLGPAISALSLAVIGCAVAVLTVDRMIPVAVAMVGTHAAAATVAFVGWFGPRGLASILFGLLLLEEGEVGSDLFDVVAWTVVLSVVAHGATAAAGARRYGRWWATMSADERREMPEGLEVDEQRPRSMP